VEITGAKKFNFAHEIPQKRQIAKLPTQDFVFLEESFPTGYNFVLLPFMLLVREGC